MFRIFAESFRVATRNEDRKDWQAPGHWRDRPVEETRAQARNRRQRRRLFRDIGRL